MFCCTEKPVSQLLILLIVSECMKRGIIFPKKMKRRIGIVGFGHLGKFLTEAVIHHPDLELAFVWNRSKEPLKSIDQDLVLEDLSKFEERNPDLIVEVSHPDVVKQYGNAFVKACDFMCGSPTAFADLDTESMLKSAAEESGNGVYVPNGALWGGEDIRRMADGGSLKALTVTMRKHPSSFKLNGYLAEDNLKVATDPVTLYEGPVRPLCFLAPNNVNTMAAAAIAAHNLGLDNTIGRLISDPSIPDWHVIEVEVYGPTFGKGHQFSVKTVRSNPAPVGAVTGSATYMSFLASILNARGKGGGIHLC